MCANHWSRLPARIYRQGTVLLLILLLLSPPKFKGGGTTCVLDTRVYGGGGGGELVTTCPAERDGGWVIKVDMGLMDDFNWWVTVACMQPMAAGLFKHSTNHQLYVFPFSFFYRLKKKKYLNEGKLSCYQARTTKHTCRHIVSLKAIV